MNLPKTLDGSPLRPHTLPTPPPGAPTPMKIIALPLKAGTQTGSLINHVISGSAMSDPVVGGGCTILSWTDRRAATIVEVSASGKKVGIVEDIATPTFQGMTDSQSYTYAPGTGKPQYFSLRKNGAWVREGETAKGGQRLAIGARSHFHDFSF